MSYARGRKRHISIWHINNFSVTRSPILPAGNPIPPGRVPGRNVYVPWVPHTAHKLLTPGHRSGDPPHTRSGDPPHPVGRPPPPRPGSHRKKFVYVYVPFPFLICQTKFFAKSFFVIILAGLVHLFFAGGNFNRQIRTPTPPA